MSAHTFQKCVPPHTQRSLPAAIVRLHYVHILTDKGRTACVSKCVARIEWHGHEEIQDKLALNRMMEVAKFDEICRVFQYVMALL